MALAIGSSQGSLVRPVEQSARRRLRNAAFKAAQVPGRHNTCCCAAPSGSILHTDEPLLPRRNFLLQVASAAGALALSEQLLPSRALAATAGPRQLPPDAKTVVDDAFKKLVARGKAPVMLRLAFHDAGTYSVSAGGGGPNASVRFELDRPENSGLKRGWRLAEQVAEGLKGTVAEGLVSDADIIALAGAWAVEVTGGPRIEVPVGRVDAAEADPEGRLPSERSTPEQLKSAFADKGLGVEEMVVLAGAHTLGSKGFGNPVAFDNTYFTSLLERPWLKVSGEMAEHIGLPSDRSLPDDPECAAVIRRYAADQAAFFADFSTAYLKMTTQGARWA